MTQQMVMLIVGLLLLLVVLFVVFRAKTSGTDVIGQFRSLFS